MSVPLLAYNANEIIPRLWLGSIDPTHDDEFFRSRGITHVVTALESHPHSITQIVFPSEHTDRYTTPAMVDAGVKQFHAPVYDHPSAPLGYYFTEACRFIHDALTNNPTNVVYVHCFAGISRSSTLVAAYLILRYEMTPNAAIEAIRAKRPQVDPNPGFRGQLVWWHDYTRAGMGVL
jgi:protein tyrosine phosphatase